MSGLFKRGFVSCVDRSIIRTFSARQLSSTSQACNKPTTRSKRPNSSDTKKGKSYASVAECKERGIALLRDPKFNKGMGFTLRERQIMGIHGLLPPTVFSQDQQVKRMVDNFHRWQDDLDKFIYLTALMDRNEKLFYRVVSENIDIMAPIIYTPTVGRACQNFGFIFSKPRGLYITINDVGHVYDILCNWPEQNVKAIVVTDGERILGLGDLGAFGMGIPIGKLSLYTAMGGVPPEQCLPIVLDVGTDNDQLLSDSTYIGLRHKRVRGHTYDALIDEFMEAVVRRYGQNTLIQFEDFANHNAFRLLEKYRNQYLTFNDDIQGTASVALAGIIAAMRITNTRLSDHKYLFQGAGEASIGIANLLVMAMEEAGTAFEEAKEKIFLVDSRGLITEAGFGIAMLLTTAMMEWDGVTKEEACSKIWLNDIGGLLTVGRPTGGINEEKAIYAKKYKHMVGLEEICREIQPSVAIGAAAVHGAFTPQFIKDMASFNDRPIIFALSNPTSKAECTAEEAYTLTEGRAIFASGSPFNAVEFGGKTFYPGQGNNAYIFPGVALGAIVAGAHHITDGMFLKASQTLADMVTQKHLDEGRVYPPLKDIREVSTKIAATIVEYTYRHQLAGTYPEPENKIDFVRKHQYNTSYESFVPVIYPWPGMSD